MLVVLSSCAAGRPVLRVEASALCAAVIGDEGRFERAYAGRSEVPVVVSVYFQKRWLDLPALSCPGRKLRFYSRSEDVPPDTDGISVSLFPVERLVVVETTTGVLNPTKDKTRVAGGDIGRVVLRRESLWPEWPDD